MSEHAFACVQWRVAAGLLDTRARAARDASLAVRWRRVGCGAKLTVPPLGMDGRPAVVHVAFFAW